MEERFYVSKSEIVNKDNIKETISDILYGTYHNCDPYYEDTSENNAECIRKLALSVEFLLDYIKRNIKKK